MMRRAHAGDQFRQADGYQGSSTKVLEDENQHLENQLSAKVKTLKHLTIDIGTEVKEQNKLLSDMDNDFDNTGGFLGNTMKRVQLMAKAGHNRYIFYLLAFTIAVFIVIWLIVKWR